MLTPFSLRSRHGDAASLTSLIPAPQQQDQPPRRRSGSDRYLPVTTQPVAAELHGGHRGSDGSPRISLPAAVAAVAVTDDVTDYRAQGAITSSGQPVAEAPTGAADAAGVGTTTITTKSSQDLNARLAASLSRWNARQAPSDELKTTPNKPPGSDQTPQVAETGDVTGDRAQGAIASLARETSKTETGSDTGAKTAVIGDVGDSRAPEVTTSSLRVAETAITVQASGTRSTPAVQPSAAAAPRPQPPSRQPHSASMSENLNVEPKTTDDRSTPRPRFAVQLWNL